MGFVLKLLFTTRILFLKLQFSARAYEVWKHGNQSRDAEIPTLLPPHINSNGPIDHINSNGCVFLAGMA